MKSIKIAVTVTREVTWQELTDMVITAFEGGSNYWITKAEPAILTADKGWLILSAQTRKSMRGPGSTPPYANPEFWEFSDYGYIISHDPDEDGNSVGTGRVLTRITLAKALEKMSDEFPQSLQRLLNGEYDIEDADTLMQIAMFGEVVYG